MKKTIENENRRRESRRGGIHIAWAIIMLEDMTEIPCWIINESSEGMGLESRKAFNPCPVEAGGVYWMRIKPSRSRKDAWIAGTVRHIKEKGAGSGIYRFGVKIVSVPPLELGAIPDWEE